MGRLARAWTPAFAGIALLLSGCVSPVSATSTTPTPLPAVAGARATILPSEVQQGALVIGTTHPAARVEYAGRQVRVSPEGTFAIGVSRDAPSPIVIAVTQPGSPRTEHRVVVQPRDFPAARR